jgi:DNA-binding NarL/FixJ family response regulator
MTTTTMSDTNEFSGSEDAALRQPIRLLVLDDHVLFRDGLRSLLAQEPSLRVTAEAGTVAEAIQAVSQDPPDVALVDLSLPDVSGMAAIAELKRIAKNLRVLVLSAHDREEYIAQAFDAGAAGYVLKEQSAQELVGAVEMVVRGQPYVSPRVSRFLLDGYISARRGDAPRSPLARLTPRERTVFEMLARGQTNAEIAAELEISIKTVETHRARLLRKLGLRSLAELVRFAVRHGLAT